MVEERLQVHPDFAEVAAEGVPDVRVIVYRGIPVMCMTRLPTQRSAGRANLHQGAIGAGVHLGTGRTHHAVQANRPIARHPDSDRSVIGLLVPHFDRVLDIAVRATDTTGLGYVGADVVVDAVRGPVVLELNARPGLAIQSANHAGLRPRLDAVDRDASEGLPVLKRIELGQMIARESHAAVEGRLS
jgi:alpha-L-glutamate ligase-like protein